MTDIDLNTDWARFNGKGDRDRRTRFGPRTARVLSRYLRAHPAVTAVLLGPAPRFDRFGPLSGENRFHPRDSSHGMVPITKRMAHNRTVMPVLLMAKRIVRHISLLCCI